MFSTKKNILEYHFASFSLSLSLVSLLKMQLNQHLVSTDKSMFTKASQKFSSHSSTNTKIFSKHRIKHMRQKVRARTVVRKAL